VKTTFTRIANDPSTPEQDRKTAEEGIASVERGEAARELARNADAAGKAMSATNIQSMDSMKARMDGPKIMGTEDLTSLIISNEPSAANPTVKLATAEANPSNLGALNLAVSSLALTKPDASVERS
jgi:hypothetical protein